MTENKQSPLNKTMASTSNIFESTDEYFLKFSREANKHLPQDLITTTKPKKKYFRFFLLISIIVILTIYAFVFHLYQQNQKAKESLRSKTALTNLPTPTISFSADWIKIQNGNVVLLQPGKDPVILVDKKDYEQTGITGFSKVSVSPNNKFLCFEALPPVREPAIYISNIDGSNVKLISRNKQNCTFSPDERKIFYVNLLSSKSIPVNIFEFDILEPDSQEKNLTIISIPAGIIRRYEIVGFSSDNQKLICKYEDINKTNEEGSGNCQINLETQQVEFF